MTRYASAVLAALVLAGCKVIALGDSNTCFGPPCNPGSWPALLQEHLDDARALWTVENRGMLGMTAARFRYPNGQDVISAIPGVPTYAAFHLEKLLAENDLPAVCRRIPFAAFAPRLVIALGTNDILRHPAWVVADDILALRRRAEEAAPCVRVYVATLPPLFGKDQKPEPQRLVANALLRARVPPDRLVDFERGFVREDFGKDGIHASPAGQAKRAGVVLRTLFPGLASDG